MKKLNQSFGLFPTLAAVVVIAVISVGGGLIYRHNHKKANASTASQATSPSLNPASSQNTSLNKTSPQDETASWKKVDSIGGAFSIKVPDGWKLVNYPSNTLNGDNVTYTPGKTAVITSGTNAYAGDQRKFNVTISDQQAMVSVEKIKVLPSDTAIKYMEEDIMKIEKQIETLSGKRAELESKKPIDIGKVLARVRYFAENLDKLLLQQINPIKRGQFFGAIFDWAPTYEEINRRNQNSPLFAGVSPVLALAATNNFSLGDLTGNRTPVTRMKT